MSLTWVILPIIGGLIGWVTNFVAIRMLFRPKRPVRVLGIPVQGVLPQRQSELAAVIAQTVENDLLPLGELLESLDLRAYSERIVEDVVAHVDERIQAQIPDIFPPAMKRLVVAFARGMIEREAPRLIDGLIDRLTKRLESDIHVGDFVRAKVEAFDVSELEAIAIKVARTELRMIEVLGAVLGGLIGLVQAAIVNVLP